MVVFWGTGEAVREIPNMDEIVLQRISTSMSVDNFTLSSRNRERGEVAPAEPVGGDNVELLLEVVDDLQARVDHGHDSGEVEDTQSDVEELLEILLNYDFQALIEAHDLVANKTVEVALQHNNDIQPEVGQWPIQGIPPLPSLSAPVSARSNGYAAHDDTSCAVRMVSLIPGPSSDLGMTVRCEKGRLVVARIMIGGLVDKQGMLHIGDTITEVNGQPVHSVPVLQAAVQAQTDTLTFTVIPSWTDHPKPLPTHMKAFFYYDPQYDRLLPSQSLGLTFAKGDILEVFNVNDDKFWQARHLGETGTARLIPSQDLQEIRMSRVEVPSPTRGLPHASSLLGLKKRKKIIYGGQMESLEIDRNELMLYEEVMRVPAFVRKTIIFIGPSGSSRRKLISDLIRMYPDRYGYPVPHTSRAPRPGEVNGRQYFFEAGHEMRSDIWVNRYVEHGEYHGNLYGTKLETVRSIIQAGKVCLLDCSPQCLKLLRTREFLPYVVFVTPAHFETPNDSASSNGLASGGTLRSCTMDNMKADSKKIATSTNGAEKMNLIESEAALLFRIYEPYVDLHLVTDHFELAFCTLLRALEKSETQEQWIPAAWIY